jgi:hypothetical protein
LRTGDQTLDEILGSERKELFCPPIQREYKWTNDKRAAFLDDIEQAINAGDSHFMGTLIIAPGGSVERQVWNRFVQHERFMVVDGQQRLTTASLLLRAVLAQFSRTPSSEQIEELSRKLKCALYATNTGVSRLTLTESDQIAYENALRREADGNREVDRAARFFKEYLSHKTDEELIDIATTALHSLRFVVIELSETEDPCAFFAAANGRGTPLTPAELTKNLLMMKSGEPDLEAAAAKYWLPLTSGFKDAQVQQFILSVTHIHHGWVTPGKIYRKLEVDLKNVGIDAFFANLQKWKSAFQHLDANAGLQKGGNASLLQELRRLSFNRKYLPSTGVVLWAVPTRMWQEGSLTDNEFAQCLKALDNFAIRVFGAYKNFVRDIVPAVGAIFLKGLKGSAAVKEYESVLFSHESYRDRTDEHLAAYLLRMRFKRSVEEQWVVAAILGLEAQARKEGFSLDLPTLEHVMPKKWSTAPGWKDIPRDFEGKQYMLGNLTVLTSPMNGDASRSPYASKRIFFTDSMLQFNRELAHYTGPWDAGHIERRGQELVQRICKAWPQQ